MRAYYIPLFLIICIVAVIQCLYWAVKDIRFYHRHDWDWSIESPTNITIMHPKFRIRSAAGKFLTYLFFISAGSLFSYMIILGMLAR